jgi:hypothetical protein
MQTTSTLNRRAPHRRHERGAALITVLLVSTLILAAGGAVILTTAMTATTAFDATGEAQAYTAAEAGIQAALNVLRGNVAPNPLPTPNPTSPASIADDNKINFRRAYTRGSSATPSTPSSNKPTDPATAPIRLSRWLNYNYTSPGSTYPDRVVLGDPASYSPITGMAYSVTVDDPDNSTNLDFTTDAVFKCNGVSNCSVSANNREITFTTPVLGVGSLKIIYHPRTSAPFTANMTNTAQNLGKFEVVSTGTILSIPSSGSTKPTFTLKINQTAPWSGSTEFIAAIATTAVPAVSVSTLDFTYTSATAGETRYQLCTTCDPLEILKPAAGQTTIGSTITAPDPRRLLIRSFGYGPRGSQKRLAMEVNRFKFNLDPPAPIVIRGADPASTGATPAEMTFDLGSSNAKHYSGKDKGGIDAPKPSVAIDLYDWHEGHTGIKKGSTVDDPELSILDIDTIPNPWPSPAPTPLTPAPGTGTPVQLTPESVKTPDWLTTADKARVFLLELETIARSTGVTPSNPNGRYFDSTTKGTLSGMAGDDSPYTPMITFVDGDFSLEGGSGLLIVTGELTLNGNSDFKGVILVLGGGKVQRSGGGNGNIEGSWVLARFNRTFPLGTESRKFLAPSFNVSGGGNSDFDFDSRKVRDANNLLGSGVVGVVEY